MTALLCGGFSILRSPPPLTVNLPFSSKSRLGAPNDRPYTNAFNSGIVQESAGK